MKRRIRMGENSVKFKFYNDTGRIVSIHPATFSYGCSADDAPIEAGEERLFHLPANTFQSAKMWDYGEDRGLQIFVSPETESD